MPPFNFGQTTAQAFTSAFQSKQDRQAQRERQRARQRLALRRLRQQAEQARKNREQEERQFEAQQDLRRDQFRAQRRQQAANAMQEMFAQARQNELEERRLDLMEQRIEAQGRGQTDPRQRADVLARTNLLQSRTSLPTNLPFKQGTTTDLESIKRTVGGLQASLSKLGGAMRQLPATPSDQRPTLKEGLQTTTKRAAKTIGKVRKGVQQEIQKRVNRLTERSGGSLSGETLAGVRAGPGGGPFTQAPQRGSGESTPVVQGEERTGLANEIIRLKKFEQRLGQLMGQAGRAAQGVSSQSDEVNPAEQLRSSLIQRFLKNPPEDDEQALQLLDESIQAANQ